MFWTRHCSEHAFSDSDWKILEGIVETLGLLYEVSTELCAEKSTSLSKVIPLAQGLIDFYNGK